MSETDQEVLNRIYKAQKNFKKNYRPFFLDKKSDRNIFDGHYFCKHSIEDVMDDCFGYAGREMYDKFLNFFEMEEMLVVKRPPEIDKEVWYSNLFERADVFAFLIRLSAIGLPLDVDDILAEDREIVKKKKWISSKEISVLWYPKEKTKTVTILHIKNFPLHVEDSENFLTHSKHLVHVQKEGENIVWMKVHGPETKESKRFLKNEMKENTHVPAN